MYFDNQNQNQIDEKKSLSVFVFQGLIYGGLYSFGLLYNDFLKSTDAETGTLSILIGTFFGAMSVASLFANALFHRFTMRSVGLCGALCYLIGSVMSIFVTSVGQLIVAYSVLQGDWICTFAYVLKTCFSLEIKVA